MRRLGRWILNGVTALSLLLCVATVVLWARSRTTLDQALWTYDRYRPDKSAANNLVCIASSKRLWLTIAWGHIGASNRQAVWGYYVNADKSGGHPRLETRHERYDQVQTRGLPKGDEDAGTSGLGPLRWQTATHRDPSAGEHQVVVILGVSHWLFALLLSVPTVIRLNHFRQARRARNAGLCRACPYDLTGNVSGVCPECGGKIEGVA